MALIVNGKPIDEAVLEGEFAGIKSYHERLGNISCCERDPEFRATAKQNIIARVLLTEEAQRSIAERPAAEVDAAFERVKEQHGGEAQFLAAVGAYPDQIPMIRRDIEMELRVNKMLEELCVGEGEPSEAQMRA